MKKFFLQIQSVWKGSFAFYTKSMYMRKHSPLTPFIAHGILKIHETGIRNALARRYIAREPNCKPLHPKGNPLGMEKFASLFALYLIGLIVSFIIFVMENVFKPSRTIQNDDTRLMIKMDEIQRELQSFSDDKKLQIFLLDEVRRVYLKD